jgi:DNA invertase Pin-like site-specific DNA recombinase
MKRVVIYARVSTRDKQETENQLRQLKDFCRKMDWELTHQYVDRVSGKSSDREQFQAMFAAASRREFDCILFWALDRFTREGTLATLQYLQRLTGYGIDYKSFTEQYLDSCGPFRDAVIGILATIAKQERIRLSERVIAGLQRARAQGRVGGRPPLPEKTRRRALRLWATGISFGKIAAQVGISKMSVSRIVADAG